MAATDDTEDGMRRVIGWETFCLRQFGRCMRTAQYRQATLWRALLDFSQTVFGEEGGS